MHPNSTALQYCPFSSLSKRATCDGCKALCSAGFVLLGREHSQSGAQLWLSRCFMVSRQTFDWFSCSNSSPLYGHRQTIEMEGFSLSHAYILPFSFLWALLPTFSFIHSTYYHLMARGSFNAQRSTCRSADIVVEGIKQMEQATHIV